MIYGNYIMLTDLDPSGLYVDHSVRWDHHWFPVSRLEALKKKCSCLKIDRPWIDKFTTPIEPGGTKTGMLHGWIHNNESKYLLEFDAVLLAAPDCCSALIGIQFLIVRTLQNAVNYHNGPDGPLQPDPSSFLPWPSMSTYRSDPPDDNDPFLLSETAKACHGYVDRRVPSRTPATIKAIGPTMPLVTTTLPVIAVGNPNNQIPVTIIVPGPDGNPLIVPGTWPIRLPIPPNYIPAGAPPNPGIGTGPGTGPVRLPNNIRPRTLPRIAIAA